MTVAQWELLYALVIWLLPPWLLVMLAVGVTVHVFVLALVAPGWVVLRRWHLMRIGFAFMLLSGFYVLVQLDELNSVQALQRSVAMSRVAMAFLLGNLLQITLFALVRLWKARRLFDDEP